jgi:hypothetical protein
MTSGSVVAPKQFQVVFTADKRHTIAQVADGFAGY